MSTVVDYGAYTNTRSIADRLGVDRVTVGRWAKEWTGGNGSGHHYSLTLVDLLVARAWQVINGQFGLAYETGRNAPLLRDLAEAAIRRAPRRWLLIDERRAETFDEAEDAGLAWLWSHDTPAATLIDLWSTP